MGTTYSKPFVYNLLSVGVGITSMFKSRVRQLTLTEGEGSAQLTSLH
jgi:hypothetical protein